MRWLIRMWYRIRTFHDYGAELNKRITVEHYLIDCAIGKKPLPDKKECARLAKILGAKND